MALRNVPPIPREFEDFAQNPRPGPTSANPADNMTDLVAFLMGKPPYPAKAAFSGVVLEDTHANRLAKYPASGYPIGSVFFETDNLVFLLNESVSGVNTWVPRWAYPILDLRANMASYFSMWWPQGMLYEQSDVNLIYSAKQQVIINCVVASDGLSVTYGGTDNPFKVGWNQYRILVNLSLIHI